MMYVCQESSWRVVVEETEEEEGVEGEGEKEEGEEKSSGMFTQG